MKRKAATKQLALAIDTGERERISHTLDVDLRTGTVGQLIGNGMRTVACPRCGMNCIVERTEQTVRFVHQGLIGSTARTTHWRRTRFCALSKEEFAAAVAAGRITVNRTGQVLSTTGNL